MIHMRIFTQPRAGIMYMLTKRKAYLHNADKLHLEYVKFLNFVVNNTTLSGMTRYHFAWACHENLKERSQTYRILYQKINKYKIN